MDVTLLFLFDFIE